MKITLRDNASLRTVRRLMRPSGVRLTVRYGSVYTVQAVRQRRSLVLGLLARLVGNAAAGLAGALAGGLALAAAAVLDALGHVAGVERDNVLHKIQSPLLSFVSLILHAVRRLVKPLRPLIVFRFNFDAHGDFSLVLSLPL